MTNTITDNKISRTMSLILRHNPQAYAVNIGEDGFASIDDVASALNVSIDDINRIVENDSKQRFEIRSRSGQTLVRAAQGHSFPVNLGYAIAEPPAKLFHGTTSSSVSSIMSQGIDRMSRHAVHLSADRDTALIVASRRKSGRGRPAIMTVDALKMHNDGLTFHLSSNGVWLVDFVPAQFISNIEFCEKVEQR